MTVNEDVCAFFVILHRLRSLPQNGASAVTSPACNGQSDSQEVKEDRPSALQQAHNLAEAFPTRGSDSKEREG